MKLFWLGIHELRGPKLKSQHCLRCPCAIYQFGVPGPEPHSMPESSPTIRPFRNNGTTSIHHDGSPVQSERLPFLTQEQIFINSPTLEDGSFADAAATRKDFLKRPKATCLETSPSLDDLSSTPSFRWRLTGAIQSLRQLLGRPCTLVHKEHVIERGSLHKSIPNTPLRRVLRLVAYALMLL